MAGELKKEICCRDNCELCRLLNDLFAEPGVNDVVSILNGKYDKYEELFHH